MVNDDQKPLHVIKVRKADITDEEFTKHLNDGMKVAQEKADELSVHFPPGVDMFVSNESDDEELRFYLNFKMEF